MDSKITINIVEPGSGPTPDPVVPNTGLFTSGIGGPEATVIGTVLILTIAAIVVAVCYRKQKKSGKVTKLVHLVDSTKAIITSKKRLSAALTAIALLVSAGTFVALARNAVNASESDEQATEDTSSSSLTVDVSSEELTIEVADEPVFAVLPVEVTVEEATEAGYTLTAYTDNTDLVSTTNPDNIIPMVTLPESSVETLESSETAGELPPLTDNTYGLALEEKPTTKDAEVYMPLSTDSDNPTILKATDYVETEANDTTTIYYGFYITPDVPYGTYTNDSEVYYNATINTTPVTFDGNGLYFNGDPEQTTNEVEYIAVPEEGKEYNINQIVSGEYKEPSQDLPYSFLGWSTDKNATVPTYETEEKIAEFLPISPNTPITLYAVWQKATTITYDGNGADSGTMDTQTIITGESDSLYENAFVKDGYSFNGWNTVAEPTEQTPGKSYTDKELYRAETESANVTLYAQWKKLPVISDLINMQDLATLSEAEKNNILSSMVAGQQYQLKDNRNERLYYISKLADGNIWMTQNLDLDIEAGRTYTSADTDLPSGVRWTPTSGEATHSTGTVTWNWSVRAPESYDPGDLCWSGTPRSSTTESCNQNNIHYHLGNYYTWTAAVAMSDSSTYTTQGQDVNQSICPAGWMLPKSGGQTVSGSFEYLRRQYSGNNIWSEPLYFPLSGKWGGGFDDVGSNGFYWSSVVNSVNNAYFFYFNFNNSTSPVPNYDRSNGFSVRCVAR